jgi:hypothetical protein
VPSWDLVLGPVKDVGVLYALGDHHVTRAAMSAHHDGVAEAVAYLDAHVGTRRGHGGHEKVSAKAWWWSGSTTAPAGKAIRSSTPIQSSPIWSRVRIDGGPPWTATTSMPTGGRPTRCTAAYQRALTRWSNAVWWACQDLNLGPHPYQQDARNRCAKRRCPRSRPTVRAEVMCFHRVQLCALATRLELPGHAVVITASFGASPPPFTTINASYSANGRSLGRVTDAMSMCGCWPRFPARSSGRMILAWEPP